MVLLNTNYKASIYLTGEPHCKTDYPFERGHFLLLPYSMERLRTSGRECSGMPPCGLKARGPSSICCPASEEWMGYLEVTRSCAVQ